MSSASDTREPALTEAIKDLRAHQKRLEALQQQSREVFAAISPYRTLGEPIPSRADQLRAWLRREEIERDLARAELDVVEATRKLQELHDADRAAKVELIRKRQRVAVVNLHAALTAVAKANALLFKEDEALAGLGLTPEPTAWHEFLDYGSRQESRLACWERSMRALDLLD